jgi:hypothetical protein
VDHDDAWVTRPQLVGSALATMRRAVVDDPEHAARRSVGHLVHDVIDQTPDADAEQADAVARTIRLYESWRPVDGVSVRILTGRQRRQF